MKFLFVLEYYSPHIGGAEVLFKNLCEGLAARGHNVTVVTLRLPKTVPFEMINGVKVHRVKTPKRGARYWFTFVAIPRALALAKQVDVIHTTTYNGALPGWLAAKLTGKKCLITVHEVIGSQWAHLAGMTWLMAKLHQLLERLILTLPFDMYVSVSQYTAGCLANLGIDQKRRTVIYNGIDHNLFNPEKADGNAIRYELNLGNRFIYMYYGRPGISKGVEYLVQAAPLIKQKIPDSKLLMLLANDPKDQYEKIRHMIRDLNIADSIILLDPVPRNDLPGYIAASDCVVVPSLSEGFGFTAAEACAMGKPVVASNVASLPEVVSGRYILVEPRNPESIARAVIDIYNGNAKYSERKMFSWEKCIQSYLGAYHQLKR